SLRRFDLPELVPAIYDGDTPTDQRTSIRRRANVVLTNPDMLHVGILPYHDRWADFLHRLRYVVVDEIHTLRGIFGTHVAMILRRLRRLASHYGAHPTFIMSSATIGNAGGLASLLTGLDVAVFDRDDSPAGERTTALWNPALTDQEGGRRRSPLGEAAELFSDLVERGFRTIVFTRGRKSTELVYRWARQRLSPDLAKLVASYRAGYTPAQRREIEQKLFGGELRGVIATSALELGIDVGGLDAALVVTFPGTMAAFRQQTGRAGRSGQESLAVLIAGEDALDQYLMSHPQELFSRPSEEVVINPRNPLVAEAHAGCAAYELPLRLEDREILGDSVEEAANRLVQAGHLRHKEGTLYWARRSRPAPAIDIRASGGPAFVIMTSAPGDAPRMIGTLDEGRVYRDAHVGAVYLHQGESYVVEELEPSLRQVRVRRADVDYYTQTRQESDLTVVDQTASAALGRANLYLGIVEVESRIISYQRRRLGSRELIDTIDLDLPPSVMTTTAVWMTMPGSLLDQVALGPDLLGALHAAEHGAIALLPLMAVCDRWDIGGLSTNWHPATGTATIFIHEGYPGGAGISPIAFERSRRHWEATVDAIRRCPCARGCPSCIQSPKCGNLNEPLSKAGAVRLLEGVLDQVGPGRGGQRGPSVSEAVRAARIEIRSDGVNST
ncbi:MAG TPA: Zn-binding domain-containing protein, partial [Acidimicrobiia bacterium]|nr:Zn-binding domain-containing protein [Acidimicrobiia bacterium]